MLSLNLLAQHRTMTQQGPNRVHGPVKDSPYEDWPDGGDMHVLMISKGYILYDGRSWRLMKREKGLVQIMPLNLTDLHCLSNKYGVLPQIW